MTEIAVQTNQLTRQFGALHAVNSLTLEVPSGIVFGFLGPNGAGKTTTIRLLLGLLEPSQGQAHVLGYDTSQQAAQIRSRCGALLEHNGIYERLSAEDNLQFYGRAWRLSSQERGKRVRELLSHFGLWERRTELAGKWSRGMKQKLAVARALLHSPELVFLDEPTAGLDPVAAAALRDDLAALAEREGVTIFLTTHNLAEAEKLCRQVGVIRDGRLLAVGSLSALRARSGSARLEITGEGFNDQILADLTARPEVKEIKAKNGGVRMQLAENVKAAPLVRLLVESGVEIEEVRKGDPSLEEVFLSLVDENK